MTTKILPCCQIKKCVICLDDCIAKNRCSQCNICIMCSKCFENQYEKCPTCRLECDYCKNNIEHSTCTWTKDWHSDNCEICLLISDKLFAKTLNLLMFSAFVMFCYAIGTVLRRTFNDDYPETFIVSLLDIIGGLVIVSLLLFIIKLFNYFYNECKY